MNKKLLLSLLTCGLLVTSCGSGSTSIVEPSEKPTEIPTVEPTLTPSEDPTLGPDDYQSNKWPLKLQKMMDELLGEKLPWIQFGSGFIYEYIKNVYQDDILFIYEEQVEDLGKPKQYAEFLDKTAYEFVKMDEIVEGYPYYNYKKAIGNDCYIMLRFGYYPGDPSQGLASGFELYAALESPTYQVDDWTDTEKAVLMNHLGEIPPFPFLSNKHKVMWDNDFQAILVFDGYADQDTLDGIPLVLEEEGFAKIGDGTGYYSYERPCASNPRYKLNIDPYDYSLITGGQGVGVLIIIRKLENITNSKVWPADEINEFFMNSEDIASIPAFEGSNSYNYYKEPGKFILEIKADVTSVTNYFEKLRLNGYQLIYDKINATYIATNFKENVVLELINKQKDGKLIMTIKLNVKFGYLDIYETFPVDVVKSLLNIDSDIPSFNANSYKLYHYQQNGFVEIDAIDIENKIASEYKTLLESLGFRIEEYVEGKFEAISKDNNLFINFFSMNHYFKVAYSTKSLRS